jgi:hypothetical protein
MKKIVLLCALVCAGSLIGMQKEPSVAKTVSQGSPAMAGKQGKGDLGAFEQLPKEIRQIIAQTAIQASTSVDEAVKAIQNAGMIYGDVQLDKTAAIEILKKALSNNMDLLKNLLKNIRPNDFDGAIEIIEKLEINDLKDFTKMIHILADKFNEPTGLIVKHSFKTPVSQEYQNLGMQLLNIAGREGESVRNKIIELIKEGADINFAFGDSVLAKAISEYSLENIELLLKLGAKPTVHDLHKVNGWVQLRPHNEMFIKIKNLIEEAMKK